MARQGDEINSHHTNAGYLPGIALDPRLSATTDLAAAARAEILLLVAPAQQARILAQRQQTAVRRCQRHAPNGAADFAKC